jgi:uridine kinase
MDNFYKELPKDANPRDYDFDHPKSLDMNLLYDTLKEILTKGEAKVNLYDFKTNSHSEELIHIKLKKIFVLEGILSLYD